MEENEVKEVKETTSADTTQLKFNGIAIASFVCSMVGILYLTIPCGIVALVLGIIGVVKFDPSKEKGKWMAITGLTVGALELVIGLFAVLGVLALGMALY